MAMATMPHRVQQTLRARASTIEWPSRVQRLWGARRQHWDSFRNGVPPSASASSRCLTARSAPELRSISSHYFKAPFLPKSRPPCSLASSARCHSKTSTPFYNPSAWKESLVPVPEGLATQTQSQLLVGLVSRGSEAFLEQLHIPHRTYANFELLKVGPRLSGFGSKLLPANQAALDRSFKKEQLKHQAPVNTGHVAFGRSNYASYLRRNNDRSPRKSGGGYPSTICEAASIGRDVIDTIKEYRVNAQYRTQLKKQIETARCERRILSARSSRSSRRKPPFQ